MLQSREDIFDNQRQLTDSEMTADDYVKVDDMEETGQTLDDKDILKLVAVDNPDVLVNGDDEDDLPLNEQQKLVRQLTDTEMTTDD